MTDRARAAAPGASAPGDPDADAAGAPGAPALESLPESLVIATSVLAAARQAGVTHLVCASGSRNAPFLYAAAHIFPAEKIRVCVDERAAGFIALGVGKAGGIAAVVTTSGSAVANLHPAVAEADAAGVPLLIISADRPSELRGVGANQTTIQAGIFSGHGGAWGPSAIRGQVLIEPGLPTRTATMATINGKIRRLRPALLGAPGGSPPGPTHINVGLRDPLWPASQADLPAIRRAFIERHGTLPAAAPQENNSHDAAAAPGHPFGYWQAERGPRTIVLAGSPVHSAHDLSAAAELAQAGGWPLVAEVDSGLRASDCPQLAASPRHLLTHFGPAIERVFVYGRPTLSRVAAQLLARADVEVIICADRAAWADPTGAASAVVGRIIPPENEPSESEKQWLEQWMAASDALREKLPELIEAASELGDLECALTGPAVAGQVWHHSDALAVAASNPIRDLDTVAGLADPHSAYPARGPQRLWVNRGLAGIDGTISTAAGLAWASGAPVRALLGDLAFVHDCSALVRGQLEAGLHLQLVVVDDGGGSIFAGLEHGRTPEGQAHYRRFFQTPQRLDIATMAAACGWSYRAVRGQSELRDALREPINEAEIIHAILPPASGAGPHEGASERAELDDAIARLLAELAPHRASKG